MCNASSDGSVYKKSQDDHTSIPLLLMKGVKRTGYSHQRCRPAQMVLFVYEPAQSGHGAWLQVTYTRALSIVQDQPPIRNYSYLCSHLRHKAHLHGHPAVAVQQQRQDEQEQKHSQQVHHHHCTLHLSTSCLITRQAESRWRAAWRTVRV